MEKEIGAQHVGKKIVPCVLHSLPYSLHRTALKKFWKGDEPTADDLIRELAEPFPLKLSVNHLGMTQIDFAISNTEEVIAPELTRKPMTTRSACEAVGANADAVLQEIAEISQQAQKLRHKVVKRRRGAVRKRGKGSK